MLSLPGKPWIGSRRLAAFTGRSAPFGTNSEDTGAVRVAGAAAPAAASAAAPATAAAVTANRRRTGVLDTWSLLSDGFFDY
jgi:hypothetical protein